ncbi:MAG TPA: universal stress protein [Chroococcales cyanobacterium]
MIGRISMNILIPIDESEYSRAALDAVLERPWPAKAQFKVITVVEPFHPEAAGWQTTYVPLAIEAQRMHNEAAQKLVDEAGSELAALFGKENVTAEMHEGYIKDKILDTASHWPADLIVVGSHGRRGFGRVLLGSVSEAIARHAHCSVEIVKVRQQSDKH